MDRTINTGWLLKTVRLASAPSCCCRTPHHRIRKACPAAQVDPQARQHAGTATCVQLAPTHTHAQLQYVIIRTLWHYAPASLLSQCMPGVDSPQSQPQQRLHLCLHSTAHPRACLCCNRARIRCTLLQRCVTSLSATESDWLRRCRRWQRTA